MQLLLPQYRNTKTMFRRKQILNWVVTTCVKRIWIKTFVRCVIRGDSNMSTTCSDVVSRKYALPFAYSWPLTKKEYWPSARVAYLWRWLDSNVECDPVGKNETNETSPVSLEAGTGGHKMYYIDCRRDVTHHLKKYSSRFYNIQYNPAYQIPKCMMEISTVFVLEWGR